MSHLDLINQALQLCIKAELICVVSYLTQIVSWLMGIDRAKRAISKADAFQMQGARIWLPLEAFHGAAYASLSISANAPPASVERLTSANIARDISKKCL